MKILHVISGLGTGGAERMLQRIVTAETDTQITHEVISLGQGGDIADSLLTHGVQVSILNGKGRLSAPRVLLQAETIAKKYMPDVIQGWMYDGNMAASWLGWRTNIPCLWNVRHSIADINKERIALRVVISISARLSQGVKAIIYNSAIASSQHHALGFSNNNVIVIPNGFDTQQLKPDAGLNEQIRNELNLKQDDLLVGMVARYHPMKAHARFIKAALYIAREVPNVYFAFAGKGVDIDNAELTGMINQAGMAERFFLLGERTDVHAIHCALDLAVSSSEWGEGFSNVLAEAMAAGVPCVATDVGDARHVIGDTGVIVPPADTKALEEAILAMLLDNERRKHNGRLARERIVDKFNMDTIMQHYIELWSSVIKT